MIFSIDLSHYVGDDAIMYGPGNLRYIHCSVVRLISVKHYTQASISASSPVARLSLISFHSNVVEKPQWVIPQRRWISSLTIIPDLRSTPPGVFDSLYQKYGRYMRV